MTVRTVEDRLREEYFALLPEARRVLEELETEVRYCLLPLLDSVDKHEKLRVTSRIKDCESAVGALRRRQEGAVFDPEQPEKYSLTALKDLAGARVLAFPRKIWVEANSVLRQHPQFRLWTSDPVQSRPSGENGEPLAFKYHGYCSRNAALRAELQITPMLIGLFWEVEHSAIYKLSGQYKGVLAGMEEHTIKVYEVLRDFESEFERLIRRDSLILRRKKKKKKRQKRKRRQTPR
jgi:ppGpp synthetase/RelA/SpoT-type nucleotidyltranferase